MRTCRKARFLASMSAMGSWPPWPYDQPVPPPLPFTNLGPCDRNGRVVNATRNSTADNNVT
eukprot:43796-Prorocentrum_minimum.AAC.1